MKNLTIYQVGLTMINGVGDILARHLLESFGDAEAIFNEKPGTLQKVPGIGQLLATEIKRPEVLLKAEKELNFIEKNQLSCFFLTDKAYPKRLKECPDAPVLFYCKGNMDLNAKHMVSIVGTRNATEYGRELLDNFCKDLATLLPEALIISGLAYGIDIYAHRCALKYSLPTVAVLAHGLDRIYPAVHRNTAVEMLSQGGLLTDFPSDTNPDKANFIKRNRIVAGLSDATIVIQSAEKGGSLITADMAFSYGRDVFTFPGRVDDSYSKGCNSLIQQNKAALITSAGDFISSMRWDSAKYKGKPVQSQILFPENSTHQQIVTLLREKEEIHINQLVTLLNMPVFQLSTLLFELEIDNIIQAIPGNMYKLK